MGVREVINRRQKLVTGIAAALLLVSIAFSAYFLWGGGGIGGPEGSRRQAWYTTDDGKTFFAADAGKMSPFEHEGKLAYRCYVFTCDRGATKFVGFLERYSEQGRAKYEQYLASHAEDPSTPAPDIPMEVKRPQTADQGWVSDRSPEAVSIVTVTCPDGSRAGLRSVAPPG